MPMLLTAQAQRFQVEIVLTPIPLPQHQLGSKPMSVAKDIMKRYYSCRAAYIQIQLFIPLLQQGNPVI